MLLPHSYQRVSTSKYAILVQSLHKIAVGSLSLVSPCL